MCQYCLFIFFESRLHKIYKQSKRNSKQWRITDIQWKNLKAFKYKQLQPVMGNVSYTLPCTVLKTELQFVALTCE